jgi:hypothetical protein
LSPILCCLSLSLSLSLYGLNGWSCSCAPEIFGFGGSGFCLMDREGGSNGRSLCYYSVLGIRKDASSSDVRTAYRKLAMVSTKRRRSVIPPPPPPSSFPVILFYFIFFFCKFPVIL